MNSIVEADKTVVTVIVVGIALGLIVIIIVWIHFEGKTITDIILWLQCS